MFKNGSITPISFDVLMSDITLNAASKGFIAERLDDCGDTIMLTNASPIVSNPNVLITACFHGDEPGGAYAVCRFLRSVNPSVLRDVNVTIVPIVNVHGFRLNRRYDRSDGDPNRGHEREHGRLAALSEVGALLSRNLQRLCDAAFDGFLSLHEDHSIADTFYIIREDASPNGDTTTKRMLWSGERFFARQADGLHHDHVIENGVCDRFVCTTFESRLKKMGVERLYVSEAPQRANLDDRASEGALMIASFLYDTIHHG